jgi:Tol biopolymer transport system component
LNRAKPIFAAQFLVLGAFALLAAAGTAHAQARGAATSGKTSAPTKTSTTKAATAVAKSAMMPFKHSFYPAKMAAIPLSMTTRKLDKQTLAHFQSRAAGDQAVIRQTVLLTLLNPNVQASYTEVPDNNAHPFWTSDEKYIFFDSNRNSDTDPTTNPAGFYNLFEMFADGSGLTQVRTNTANEIEPCVSVDGTTLVYVGGGTLTFPNGLDNPVSSGFNLYTYSINNAGTPTNLTANNPSGFTFTDVRHPSFNPGGNLVVFAGQLGSGKALPHLFSRCTGTNIITQLTGPPPGTSCYG